VILTPEQPAPFIARARWPPPEENGRGGRPSSRRKPKGNDPLSAVSRGKSQAGSGKERNKGCRLGASGHEASGFANWCSHIPAVVESGHLLPVEGRRHPGRLRRRRGGCPRAAMKTVPTRDALQLAPQGGRRAHSTSGWLSNEETLHLFRPPAASAGPLSPGPRHDEGHRLNSPALYGVSRLSCFSKHREKVKVVTYGS
jgi:hypothetical protein